MSDHVSIEVTNNDVLFGEAFLEDEAFDAQVVQVRGKKSAERTALATARHHDP